MNLTCNCRIVINDTTNQKTKRLDILPISKCVLGDFVMIFEIFIGTSLDIEYFLNKTGELLNTPCC